MKKIRASRKNQRDQECHNIKRFKKKLVGIRNKRVEVSIGIGFERFWLAFESYESCNLNKCEIVRFDCEMFIYLVFLFFIHGWWLSVSVFVFCLSLSLDFLLLFFNVKRITRFECKTFISVV